MNQNLGFYHSTHLPHSCSFKIYQCSKNRIENQCEENGLSSIVQIESNQMYLTEKGELYVKGNNFGQLGCEQSYLHSWMKHPISFPLKQISLTYYHSLILTRTNKVYSSGQNSFGELVFIYN